MSNKNDDIFSSPISPAAKKVIERKFSASTDKVIQAQNDVTGKDITQVREVDLLQTSINSSINDIFKYVSPSGKNTADMTNVSLDSMLMLANKQTTQDRTTQKRSAKARKKSEAELQGLRKQVLNANKEHLNTLLALHKKKTTDSIATYNMIIRIIPKMRLAINTMANTILSPDDFTKNALSASINQAKVDPDIVGRVTQRANDLLEQFEINKHIKNDITSYLINGKLFYLVTSVNREIARMLNEQQSSTGEGVYRTLSGSFLSESVSQSLLESADNPNALNTGYLNEFASAFTTSSVLEEEGKPSEIVFTQPSRDKLSEMAGRVDKLIESEFIISDSRALIADTSEGESENALNEFASFFSASNGFNTQNVPEAHANNTDTMVSEDDIKGQNKAIVKRISPANIVPLIFDGKNFGYIHLDIVEIDPDNEVMPTDSGNTGVEGMGMLPSASGAMANGSILQNIVMSSNDVSVNGNNTLGSGLGRSGRQYENPTGSPGLDGAEDARLMFVSKVFANRLSKETNLKLLKRSDELKNAIYNGLAVKKLCSNQKVRVVYLKPEEVVFIDRGHSIFDNVLFFAKIYIATLITILMQNVLNGGEKRVVYVEVGEDNNGAHAVQEVIRDIKSKEISSIMSMDLQSILNIQSQFNSYYIPVVDGEKPISFETIDSLNNKSIDDEFLNWLSANIFSGIGIPSAYLTEVENVDFAKMLAMQNSRYLRDCIAEQSILSKGLTELLRKIYEIEYGTKNSSKNSKSSKSKENPAIDEEAISSSALSIILPPPAALALNSISEQIQNAQSTIQSIVDMSGQMSEVPDEDQEKVGKMAQSKLLRKFISGVDWSEIDSIITAAISEYTEAKITKSITDSDVDETSSEETEVDTSTESDDI